MRLLILLLSLWCGHGVNLDGESLELSPAVEHPAADAEGKAAELKMKADNQKMYEVAKQTAHNQYLEHQGRSEYEKQANAGKSDTYEKEWKARQNGANTSELAGNYAKDEYAVNDTDWEQKLGGYPSDMVAAERKQKADQKEEAIRNAAEAAKFIQEESANKKAVEDAAEKGRKAQQAKWDAESGVSSVNSSANASANASETAERTEDTFELWQSHLDSLLDEEELGQDALEESESEEK